MNTPIPIYRAKKIDSDEYVEGYLFGIWDKYYICWGTTNNVPNKVQIDPSTLAIHMDDMIDSEGTRIFASLSKDGKGGDNLLNSHMDDYKGESGVVCVINSQIRIKVRSGSNRPFFDHCGWASIFSHYGDVKVTGIQL